MDLPSAISDLILEMTAYYPNLIDAVRTVFIQCRSMAREGIEVKLLKLSGAMMSELMLRCLECVGKAREGAVGDEDCCMKRRNGMGLTTLISRVVQGLRVIFLSSYQKTGTHMRNVFILSQLHSGEPYTSTDFIEMISMVITL